MVSESGSFGKPAGGAMVGTGSASVGTGGAKLGTGGKSPGGGAPSQVCTSKILPTCDAAPELDPAWCELAAGGEPGAAGAAGAAGSAGEPDQPPLLPLLIDDLEDGDTLTGPVLGGRGGWYVVNDGSGAQFPAPCAMPSPEPNPLRPGKWEMRTYGAYFSPQPGGFANLGLALRSSRAGTCTGPVDASAYVGVKFWAHGSGFVRFSIATVVTNPLGDGGSCTENCYDAHGAVIELSDGESVHLKFDSLVQEGWGTPVPFDRSQILGFQWTPKASSSVVAPASCFDFWIDDVAFER
jgi:hypothetical protein